MDDQPAELTEAQRLQVANAAKLAEFQRQGVGVNLVDQLIVAVLDRVLPPGTPVRAGFDLEWERHVAGVLEEVDREVTSARARAILTAPPPNGQGLGVAR